MKKVFIFAITLTIVFFAVSGAQAAYVSQCDVSTEGSQTGCTDERNAAILSSQCVPFYGSTACATMSGYLSAMRSDCLQVGDSGADCEMITNGGFYGREASKFAQYLEAHPSSSSGSGSGATSGSTGAPTGQLVYPAGTGLPDPSITDGSKSIVEFLLKQFLNWLLLIIGLIAMIAFIVSGLQYFMAAGDATLAETAKRNMKYSILGIVAALSAFIIVRAVDTALRGMALF